MPTLSNTSLDLGEAALRPAGPVLHEHEHRDGDGAARARVMTWLTRTRHAWRRWRLQARAARDLHALDAYALRDIGLSHRAAAEAADPACRSGRLLGLR